MCGMAAPTTDVLALLDATLDAVVIMDDRGRISAFNRSAEEMFGYRAADAVGRNVSMLMTSADRASHDDHLRRYLAGGEPSAPSATIFVHAGVPPKPFALLSTQTALVGDCVP